MSGWVNCGLNILDTFHIIIKIEVVEPGMLLIIHRLPQPFNFWLLLEIFNLQNEIESHISLLKINVEWLKYHEFKLQMNSTRKNKGKRIWTTQNKLIQTVDIHTQNKEENISATCCYFLFSSWPTMLRDLSAWILVVNTKVRMTWQNLIYQKE